MKKKGIALVITGILAVVGVTGFAQAQSVDIFNKDVKTQTEANDKNSYKDMIKIMKENGYKDVAKAMEKNDYEAMDEFMNNMTDEDYEKMIEIMKENGYGSMAGMMESISREDMLQMHNSMGGSESCHSDNNSKNGMMGSF